MILSQMRLSVGRRQILQIAHDTFTDQSSHTEYDHTLSDNRDAALTLDVAQDKVLGVMCVLQEAAEAHAVLAIGRAVTGGQTAQMVQTGCGASNGSVLCGPIKGCNGGKPPRCSLLL